VGVVEREIVREGRGEERGGESELEVGRESELEGECKEGKEEEELSGMLHPVSYFIPSFLSLSLISLLSISLISLLSLSLISLLTISFSPFHYS